MSLASMMSAMAMQSIEGRRRELTLEAGLLYEVDGLLQNDSSVQGKIEEMLATFEENEVKEATGAFMESIKWDDPNHRLALAIALLGKQRQAIMHNIFKAYIVMQVTWGAVKALTADRIYEECLEKFTIPDSTLSLIESVQAAIRARYPEASDFDREWANYVEAVKVQIYVAREEERERLGELVLKLTEEAARFNTQFEELEEAKEEATSKDGFGFAEDHTAVHPFAGKRVKLSATIQHQRTEIADREVAVVDWADRFDEDWESTADGVEYALHSSIANLPEDGQIVRVHLVEEPWQELYLHVSEICWPTGPDEEA